MKYKKGFTLAEILITLGIIGIVAALTIPNLISKYNEKKTITNLKKTYAELLEVIKLSELDNGNFQQWNFPTDYHDHYGDEFAEKYILPYYKSVQKCKFAQPCFSKKTYNWHSPNGTYNNGGEFMGSSHYIINGKPTVISGYNTPCQSDVVDCSTQIKYAKFIINVNGINNNAIAGKDVFMFTLFNYRYKTPFSASCDGNHYGLKLGSIAGYHGGYCKTLDEMFSGNPGNCNLNGGSGFDCGLAIEKNGWKIPDKYPIKF